MACMQFSPYLHKLTCPEQIKVSIYKKLRSILYMLLASPIQLYQMIQSNSPFTVSINVQK